MNLIKYSNLNKDILANKIKLNALIDTGSEITVLCGDLFNQYHIDTHNNTQTTIKGIGSIINRIGNFDATIKMDNCESKVECATLSKQFMSVEMIIGMNFLQDFDMYITKNGVRITERSNNGRRRNRIIFKLFLCVTRGTIHAIFITHRRQNSFA